MHHVFKAKLFGDDIAAQRILAATTPKEYKAIGRQVKGFNDAVWIAKREKFMCTGCMAKFQQNPNLCSVLLAAGDTELIEASPYDRIWGIGLSIDDPRALDKTQWKGLNLLGNVLMSVRDKLRTSA